MIAAAPCTDLPFAYSLPTVAIWLALAVVIGILGATRPARAASRLTIREPPSVTRDFELGLDLIAADTL